MLSTKTPNVEDFRHRVRDWLAENLSVAPSDDYEKQQRASDGVRARELQRRLWDGRLAGICFPREYGGLGLTPDHQRAFDEESESYELPLLFNVATLPIVAPTLLALGTDEQKQTHIPAILRGDHLWAQMLSEPSGGSDLAGVLTRADLDSDGSYVLTGSKIWTTGAFWADYSICLARTDWKAPKHGGLTVFLVRMDDPGLAVHRIRMADGSEEFCQEFLDGVRCRPDQILGTINDGWTGIRVLLDHERASMGRTSPYSSGFAPKAATGTAFDFPALARRAGLDGDPHVRQLVASAHVNDLAYRELGRWIAAGIASGELPEAARAIARLFAAMNNESKYDLALDLAGSTAVADSGSGEDLMGTRYLVRQGRSLGGGSTQMQHNIVSERVLGLPREPAPDVGPPFDQVDHN